MPYASVADVPSYVDAAKRKQWIAVWNSTYNDAIASGMSKSDAEAKAFRSANGVVKKESAMFPSLVGRTFEAALAMDTSHDAMRGHVRKALMAAHDVTDTYSNNGPWIMDMFPDAVVYQHGGQTLKRSYTATMGAAGTPPKIKLGNAKKTHVAYVDSAESAQESIRLLFGDAPTNADESVTVTLPDGVIMVTEASEMAFPEVVVVREATGVAKSAPIPVRIIKPGWGSKAYYSREMLASSGPQVFRKNTHMYINHPTEADDVTRPERDHKDLAAVLASDSYWDDNGPIGPGLYSTVLPFPDHEANVRAKAPYSGVSVNVALEATPGEAEGKEGMIAQRFVKHPFNSVDVVTRAGAGGALIVTESATSASVAQQRRETTMTQQEQQEMATLRDRNAQLEKGHNLILAMGAVGAILRESGVTVDRELVERVCESPTVKDGKIDAKWAQDTAALLVKASGSGSGVSGMGDTRTHESTTTQATKADSDKKYLSTLESLGVPKAGLEYLAGVI